MKVPMFVAINVVELQPGGNKRFELCRNFTCDLPARHRIERYPDAGPSHITAKPTELVDEIGQARGR